MVCQAWFHGRSNQVPPTPPHLGPLVLQELPEEDIPRLDSANLLGQELQEAEGTSPLPNSLPALSSSSFSFSSLPTPFLYLHQLIVTGPGLASSSPLLERENLSERSGSVVLPL